MQNILAALMTQVSVCLKELKDVLSTENQLMFETRTTNKSPLVFHSSKPMNKLIHIIMNVQSRKAHSVYDIQYAVYVMQYTFSNQL